MSTANVLAATTSIVKQEYDLLSVFVVKRDNTFVFSFLRAWFKLCVLVGSIVFFLIFHVAHVSFGTYSSNNSSSPSLFSVRPEVFRGRNENLRRTFLWNGL